MPLFQNLKSKLQPTHNSSSTSAAQSRQYAIFDRIAPKKLYTVLGVGVLCSFSVALYLSNQDASKTEKMSAELANAVEIQMLSQKMSKDIQQAVSGSERSFGDLNKDSEKMQSILNKIKSTPALQEYAFGKSINSLTTTWSKASERFGTVKKGEQIILNLGTNRERVETDLDKFKWQLDGAYSLLSQDDADWSRLIAIKALNESFFRLSKTFSLVVTSPVLDDSVAGNFIFDAESTKALLNSIIKGDSVLAISPLQDGNVKNIITKLEEEAGPIFKVIDEATVNVPILVKAKNAGFSNLQELEKIYNESQNIQKSLQEQLSGVEGRSALIYLLYIVSVLLVALLAYAYNLETKRNASVALLEKDETDQAVIQLMTELSPIAGGDLAARLTVTEHVTGSIADTINSTVEQLQVAMIQIKSSSKQTKELVSSIKELSVETQAKAQEATEMARESSDLSTHGAGLVQDASERMLEARDRIQEVAKRVKRLGEVSQSIGRVSAVIEDVTEKTAILALNTSLKAEESGEAGKPFRVIADEIRKLSDSTLKALNEISDSVMSIQSETNVVIRTVEGVITNVVDGAKLWDEATGALGLIKNTAGEIDKMVEYVNDFALKQVAATQKATDLMGLLEESTDQFNTKKTQEFE